VRDKPDWWPENPYPTDIFTTSLEDATKAVEPRLTKEELSAYSAAWGRHVWDFATEDIWRRMQEEKTDEESR